MLDQSIALEFDVMPVAIATGQMWPVAMFAPGFGFVWRRTAFWKSSQPPSFIMSVTITLAVVLFSITHYAALFRMVFANVFKSIGKHQIVRMIIVSAFIAMVNVFVRFKESAKLFLHDKPVLSNTVAFIGVRVTPCIYPYVTLRHAFAAFPRWMRFRVVFYEFLPAFSASLSCMIMRISKRPLASFASRAHRDYAVLIWHGCKGKYLSLQH